MNTTLTAATKEAAAYFRFVQRCDALAQQDADAGALSRAFYRWHSMAYDRHTAAFNALTATWRKGA